MSTTTKLPGNPTCPNCTGSADGATSLGNAKPSDGDIAICAYCASINEYQISDGNVTLIPCREQKLKKMRMHYPSDYAAMMRAVVLIKQRQHD